MGEANLIFSGSPLETFIFTRMHPYIGRNTLEDAESTRKNPLGPPLQPLELNPTISEGEDLVTLPKKETF